MPIMSYYLDFAGGRPRATPKPILVHLTLSYKDMPKVSVSWGFNRWAPPISSTKTVPDPVI